MAELQSLNSSQLKAVTAPSEGHLQIIAGPGSGKTKVITCRVSYLISQCSISPASIIVTTFTKAAAKEMSERLAKVVDIEGLAIGTFHSVCYKLLKQHGKLIGIDGFRIVIQKHSDEILASLGGKDKAIRKYISYRKSIGKVPGEAVDEKSRVYFEYQQRLRQLGLMDYDDLLLYANELLKRHPEVTASVSHVLVDEFQDTSKIQLAILSKLARNVAVVGDPDQSIYGFRNAVVKNFLVFLEMFPDTVVVSLQDNYRSSQAILDLSEKLMKQDASRTSRKLVSHLTTRQVPKLMRFDSAYHEADNVAQHIKTLAAQHSYSDMAILVRTSAQIPPLEHALVKLGVPYLINKGTGFWDSPEVIAMVDLLRTVLSKDILAYLKSLQALAKGVGQKTVARVQALLVQGQSIHDVPRHFSPAISSQIVEFNKSIALSGLVLQIFDELVILFNGRAPCSPAVQGLRQQLALSLTDALTFLDNITAARATQANGVTILTIHSAKGLEFPVVFVPSLNDDIVPAKQSHDDPQAVAEERRVFYVAVTRSKQVLELSSSSSRPSRFLSSLNLAAGDRRDMPLQPAARKRQQVPANWSIVSAKSLLSQPARISKHPPKKTRLDIGQLLAKHP